MNSRKWLAMGVVFLAFAAGVAFAQSGTVEIQAPLTTSITGSIRISIPFNFTVAEKDFQAGDYYINPLNEKTLAIKSVDNGDATVVMTNTVSTISDQVGPKLIFHKYGDRNFLAQIWPNYSESGRQLRASSEEVKLARIYKQQQLALVAQH